MACITLGLRSLFLGAVLACGSTQALADQVLLLQNGNVLRGEVFRRGGRFVVKQGDSEIGIMDDEVARVFDDIRQVYDHKARDINSGDIGSHLELASWCMRQGLLAQAEEQLQIAEQLDPRHRRIPTLRRQIDRRRVPPSNAQLPQPPAPSRRRRPQESIDSPIASEPFAEFARSVQPLLINRCGNATCHGSATTSQFQLHRSPWGKMPLQLTRRNLSATLSQLKAEPPHDSQPLLTRAQTPHGGKAGPPLSDTQFDRLKAWISSMRPPAPVQHLDLESSERVGAPERFGPPDWESTSEPEPDTGNERVLDDPFDPRPFNELHATKP